MALNNAGAVLGSLYNGPFIYKDNEITQPYSTSGENSVSGINDAGDFVGSIDLKAILFSNGQIQYLNSEQPNMPYSTAMGIDNPGQIIEIAYSSNGSLSAGFLYQDGKTSLLTDLPAERPFLINSLGEIGGESISQGFLRMHGFTLETPGAIGNEVVVTGLDSSGRLSGWYRRLDGEGPSVEFIYNAGKFNLIPNPPDITKTYSQGSNDCGDIVGYNDLGAFLYSHGVFKQLGYLLTESPYNTFEPVGINDRGEIFGEVVINGVASTMTMTPSVPETCGTDATIVNNPSSTIVGPGGKVTYTIQATNLNAPTKQFTVNNMVGRESHLSGCEVTGSSGSCTISADRQTASINLPDLDKGKTATISLTVIITGSAGDQQLVMDTATLTSDSTADYLSTAYTNIRLTADMLLSASLLSNSDGLLHYQAMATDLGPMNSHAVLLLDPLPANTSFVSATTDYGVCSFHSTLGPYGSVRCPLGNLGYLVPAQVDVVLQASPAACPTVSNTFSLSTKSIDSNSSNDSSTVVTPLSGAECINGMTKQR